MHKTLIVSSALLALATMGGCPSDAVPQSVLAGTWQMDVDELDTFGPTVLKFGPFGKLTSVSTAVDGQVWEIDDPDGEAVVVGDTVEISIRFSGNTLEFVGVLDEAATQADGTLSGQVKAGLGAIPLDARPASLVRLDLGL